MRESSLKSETKVGILFLVTIMGIILFAYFLGLINPFSSAYELKIQYNFAGGIEVGSPVRVMGIKVGKVKSIDFRPSMKTDSGEDANLLISISVSKEAWKTISSDSQFYINLAGVIGEKFLEITPGTAAGNALEDGQTVRGVDPPRIDQLISQGYGLAGKLLDMVERNEGTVVGTLEKLEKFLAQMNQTLALLERISQNKEIPGMVSDLKTIVADIKPLTSGLNSKDAKDTYALLHKLLLRLEDLDKAAIKKFFQEDGIKAKLL